MSIEVAMRAHNRFFTRCRKGLAAFAVSLCALTALAGCGVFAPSSANVALTVHNPISLQNYQAARGFASEGRYELAREHYLLAYAAAEGDEPLRNDLARELSAVDMMIRSLR